LPRWLTWSAKEKKEKPFDFRNHQIPKETNVAVPVIASTIISLCSGASIIVPMITMTFNPGRTASLVTVSASVIIFGFTLAAIIRVKGSDIFVATATYAAVLVVFVGASVTSGA
jgi:hypothetical protein